MKKFISLLLDIVIIISLSACGEPVRTGMKVDEFVREYSSLQNEDSIINELFDITLADADITKDPTTKQNIYSFNLSSSDSLSRTMVEMTVKTDKNDYVDSVNIKMDESGIMYYSVVNKILCKPPTSGKIEITDVGGFKLCQEKTTAN